MIYLPPAKITQGEPFAYSATLQGQSWVGYTGSIIFKRNAPLSRRYVDYGLLTDGNDPFLTVTVTGNSVGLMQFALTIAQTALFPALPRPRFFATARGEITMKSGADAQKFQLPISVAGML